jgi:Type I restriction enzyme R protein N terminus (HSDR_N)
MPPKPFYDINPDAYLFGKSDETPEEKVRQWALFELLSTYGVCINNIEVERQVKVGTRNHRADIVILRESAPYVVIECKKWEDPHKGRGMQQALSYADANTMKARYAVYTNGDLWEVKRKIGEDWVDIPDLPKKVDGDYRIGLDQLVRSINDFKPALFWLNQTVPANSARAYFSCLQILFNGLIFPLNYLDNDLCFGTDNLLRVICAKGDHPAYLHGKLVAACQSFAAFFEKRLGKSIKEDFVDDDFRHLVVVFKMRFEDLVKDTRDLKSEDALHFRLVAALFQYLLGQLHLKGKKERFFDVPSVLTREFQDLAGYLFQIHLNVTFPDPVLEESGTYLRHFCSQAWEQFKKEDDRTSG